VFDSISTHRIHVRQRSQDHNRMHFDYIIEKKNRREKDDQIFYLMKLIRRNSRWFFIWW